MDNPVDNIVDLGLVNYVKHPSNPDYVVYRFGDQLRADSFAEALEEAGIEFERDEEVKKTVTIYLFGIHKRDYKKTVRINFMVEAKHKKPLIPGKVFRYLFLLIMATIMTLAIIGFYKQQEVLASHNESNSTLNSSDEVE